VQAHAERQTCGWARKVTLPMLEDLTGIAAARRKLREARFFLDRLRSRVKTFPLDPEEVACLSSAFLSSARSVSFALRLASPDLYDSWLPGWLSGLADSERSLCHSMVACPDCAPPADERLRNVWDIIPVTETRSDRWGHPSYSFHWFHPNGSQAAGNGAPDFYLGGPVAEVCRNCERFVLLLERLVTDYDRMTAQPSSSVT
jgi:hypothetical protein